MKIRIITHKENKYEGEAKQVVLPGRQEEFSVWDFHQPFLYRLRRGYIKILDAGSTSSKPSRVFLVSDGIARMLGNTLTVLAEV